MQLALEKRRLEDLALKQSQETVDWPSFTTIEDDNVFSECTALNSLSLPNLSKIGNYGSVNCAGCTSLEEKLKLEISSLKKQLAAVSNQSHKVIEDLASVKAENLGLLKQLEDIRAENTELKSQMKATRKMLNI